MTHPELVSYISAILGIFFGFIGLPASIMAIYDLLKKRQSRKCWLVVIIFRIKSSLECIRLQSHLYVNNEIYNKKIEDITILLTEFQQLVNKYKYLRKFILKKSAEYNIIAFINIILKEGLHKRELSELYIYFEKISVEINRENIYSGSGGNIRKFFYAPFLLLGYLLNSIFIFFSWIISGTIKISKYIIFIIINFFHLIFDYLTWLFERIRLKYFYILLFFVFLFILIYAIYIFIFGPPIIDIS